MAFDCTVNSLGNSALVMAEAVRQARERLIAAAASVQMLADALGPDNALTR